MDVISFWFSLRIIPLIAREARRNTTAGHPAQCERADGGWTEYTTYALVARS